jgi:hypothetical protein
MSRQVTTSILRGLVAKFADDALVEDQLRNYWGKPAIRDWAARDSIGANLTTDARNVIEHCGNFIVAAKVSGQFHMPGLPKLLVYAFYFSADGDRSFS